MKTAFEPEKFIGLVLIVMGSALLCVWALGAVGHIIVALFNYGWHAVDTICR